MKTCTDADVLAQLLEHASDGLAYFDRECNYVRVNRAYAAARARPAAEFAGRNYFDSDPSATPGPGPADRAPFERTRETGEAISSRAEARAAVDGTVRRWDWTLTPLRENGESVDAFILALRETPSESSAEQGSHDDGLLSALRQTIDALREADRRKDEFLAVLSHELRNPLAPIKSSVYLLRRAHSESEQAHRAIAVLERQVDQLTHLTDDLLDATRIQRQKLRLRRRKVELVQLVSRTLEDYRSLFEEGGVLLEFGARPGPVYVNADSGRMAQVVGNLLHNAVKFTDSGGKTTVSIEVDAASQRASIRVSDTGQGMSPGTLARIFQPFMQADASGGRGPSGLGLGLALVKGLVELHGGEVTAKSAGEGRGSEFAIHLPIEALTFAPPAEDREGPAPSRRRVLIIEDNVDAANTLRDVLELGGHEVAIANNGIEALSLARSFEPDIAFCDIGLPGMDGYQVARSLRSDDAMKGVFLVALTGYTLPEDLERAAQAGFDRHLAKPPSLQSLEALVAQAPHRTAPEAGPPRG